jgi:membrane protein implicated in regulation of membrane protease activity
MAHERIDNALEGANDKLEESVRENPFLQHLLDMRLVVRAVAAGVVAAVLFWLLVGPATAGFALLLVFFATWFVLARVSYDKRRESEPSEDEQEEGQQREGQPAAAS